MGDIVTGQSGVPVIDHAVEVRRYGLESVTGQFRLGEERCVIHWVQPYKFDAVIVMAAQVRSCVKTSNKPDKYVGARIDTSSAHYID